MQYKDEKELLNGFANKILPLLFDEKLVFVDEPNGIVSQFTFNQLSKSRRAIFNSP